MCRLDPISASEVANYVASVRDLFVRGSVEHMFLPPDVATTQAARIFASLTAPSPKIVNSFFNVCDGDATPPIGQAWIRLVDSEGRRDSVIMHIEIAEHARGRGLSMIVAELLEDYARSAGALTVRADVFGKNIASMRVCARAGMHVAATSFVKELSPPLSPPEPQ